MNTRCHRLKGRTQAEVISHTSGGERTRGREEHSIQETLRLLFASFTNELCSQMVTQCPEKTHTSTINSQIKLRSKSQTWLWSVQCNFLKVARPKKLHLVKNQGQNINLVKSTHIMVKVMLNQDSILYSHSS